MAWLNNTRVRRSGGVLRSATLAVLLLLSLPAARSIAVAPPGVAEAIRAQRSLLEATPRSLTLLNDLANLLALAGHAEEAEEVYRHALEVDPESVATHYNLALFHEEAGRRRLARRGFQKALKIAPDHAWSHYQLGYLAAEGGHRSKAIDYYVRAFALEPRLTMPDFNPHILANDLATQALLIAHATDSAAALAPRIYQNPGRVRELLFAPMKAPVAVSPESREATSSGGSGGIRSGGGGVGGGGLEPGELSVPMAPEGDRAEPKPETEPEIKTETEPESETAVSPATVRAREAAGVFRVPGGMVLRPRPVPAPAGTQGAAGASSRTSASGPERSGQPTPVPDVVPSEPAQPEPARSDPADPSEPEYEPAPEEPPAEPAEPADPDDYDPDEYEPDDYEPDVFSTGRLELQLVPKGGIQVASLPRNPAG